MALFSLRHECRRVLLSTSTQRMAMPTSSHYHLYPPAGSSRPPAVPAAGTDRVAEAALTCCRTILARCPVWQPELVHKLLQRVAPAAGIPREAASEEVCAITLPIIFPMWDLIQDGTDQLHGKPLLMVRHEHACNIAGCLSPLLSDDERCQILNHQRTEAGTAAQVLHVRGISCTQPQQYKTCRMTQSMITTAGQARSAAVS